MSQDDDIANGAPPLPLDICIYDNDQGICTLANFEQVLEDCHVFDDLLPSPPEK